MTYRNGWKPEPQSIVWVFVKDGVARATIPYDRRQVIKDVPDSWYDAPAKLWAFHAEWISYVTRDLRRLGYTVRVVQDRPQVHADGSPGAPKSWAGQLFAAISPDLGEKAYRALSRVLHPDTGGDSRAQQQLNDAWDHARPKAGVR